MSVYEESNYLFSITNNLGSGALRLVSGTQTFTNASGIAYTNSANLYTIYSTAIDVTVYQGVTQYTYKLGISPLQTITQYLASLSGTSPAPAPTPAPAPVVRSPLIYLGDYVTVNSSTNTVSCGSAKLSSVSDAVSDQDVPSFKQVKAVQTSLNSSLASTNANVTTVTNQVASILEGASITKFKTLIDTINALDAEDDANLVSAVATLTQKIDVEKARAESAESTLSSSVLSEKTRAETAESALSSSVSDEKTRAETAEALLRTDLTSETARATAAEAILTSNDITTINVQPFTDAMAIPSNVFAPHDGFYYTNQANKKITWYMPSPSMTFNKINYLSFNTCIHSNQQLPYIVVYSKPKGDGSDKASWYNARHVYEVFTPTTVPVNNSTTNATPYQFYCALSGSNIANMPDFGLQKLLLPLGSHQTLGTIAPNDEILYISLQTSSGTAAGFLNFTIQNFCVCAKDQTYEYKFSSASLTSAGIASNLSTEVTRALAAEAVITSSLNAQITKEAADVASLNGSISTLSTNLNTSLGAEITRAGLAESGLQSQITSLTATVNTSASDAGSGISTVATNLTNEVSRATAAESALTTRISKLEESFISFLQFHFGNSTYSSSSTFPLTFPNAHA